MITTVIRREQICDSKLSAYYFLKKMCVELKCKLVERCGYFEEPWDYAIWHFGPEAFNKIINDNKYSNIIDIESDGTRTIMGIKFVIDTDVRKMPPDGVELRFEKNLTLPCEKTRYDLICKSPGMHYNKEQAERFKRIINETFGIGGKHMRSIKENIKEVIFNDPATIILWKDGTKTVVKCENEPYDPEKGLAMAIVKKALGNKGNYYDIFRKWLPKEDKE